MSSLIITPKNAVLALVDNIVELKDNIIYLTEDESGEFRYFVGPYEVIQISNILNAEEILSAIEYCNPYQRICITERSYEEEKVDLSFRLISVQEITEELCCYYHGLLPMQEMQLNNIQDLFSQVNELSFRLKEMITVNGGNQMISLYVKEHPDFLGGKTFDYAVHLVTKYNDIVPTIFMIANSMNLDTSITKQEMIIDVNVSDMNLDKEESVTFGISLLEKLETNYLKLAEIFNLLSSKIQEIKQTVIDRTIEISKTVSFESTTYLITIHDSSSPAIVFYDDLYEEEFAEEIVSRINYLGPVYNEYKLATTSKDFVEEFKKKYEIYAKMRDGNRYETEIDFDVEEMTGADARGVLSYNEYMYLTKRTNEIAYTRDRIPDSVLEFLEMESPIRY